MASAHGLAHDGIFQNCVREISMKLSRFPQLPASQQGKAGYILLWLLGVPIPILFLIYLLRGCT